MALLKYLFIGMLGLTLMYADTPEHELIVKTLKLLSRHGKPLSVYEHNATVTLGRSWEGLTRHCEKADLVYGTLFESLMKECQKLPRFTTDYEVFLKDKNVIGAFYWRKGRPQLRFNKERCDDFEIHLPSELERYAQ